MLALFLVLGAATAGAGAHASHVPGQSTIDGLLGEKGDRTITYVGSARDHPDLRSVGLGTAGSWFPQFAASVPVTGRPTGDNARDGLPTWVGAFNHTTGPAELGCLDGDAVSRGCLPSYYFRTFSQDGPARSSGGHPAWSRLCLPYGECGISGAIVDPHTSVGGEPNTNNTVNRIQLRHGTPSSFLVAVVADTTAGAHDPSVLEIRGNVGLIDVPSEVADSQVEPTFPSPMDLVGNGVPDVHVFRVDGFRPGDYLKLRLRGANRPAAFAGLLFDDAVSGW